MYLGYETNASTCSLARSLLPMWHFLRIDFAIKLSHKVQSYFIVLALCGQQASLVALQMKDPHELEVDYILRCGKNCACTFATWTGGKCNAHEINLGVRSIHK